MDSVIGGRHCMYGQLTFKSITSSYPELQCRLWYDMVDKYCGCTKVDRRVPLVVGKVSEERIQAHRGAR